MVEVHTMLNEQDLLFERHSAAVDQRKCIMFSWRQNCKQYNLIAQRGLCSLLSLYLPHFKQTMLWRNETCKSVVFIANMQQSLQPKKGVVIYKLVVAFELAQFFLRKNFLYEGWNLFFLTLYKMSFPPTDAVFFKDWMLNLKLQPC